MATTTAVEPKTPTFGRAHYALLALFAVVLLWSGIHPYSYFTWFLEIVPALIGLLILAATWRRFQFTTLVYTIICLHAIILMVGGHYTYARVPLFNWISATLHLARNHYDRLGHFAQGFVPAMVAREVFVRRGIVKKGGWTVFLVICLCMAVSAWYELFEYGVAVATGTAADDFLGSQGDPWDTQNDMLMAFIGSGVAMLATRRWHDSAIARLAEAQSLDR
jgi:putative membrane protein